MELSIPDDGVDMATHPPTRSKSAGVDDDEYGVNHVYAHYTSKRFLECHFPVLAAQGYSPS